MEQADDLVELTERVAAVVEDARGVRPQRIHWLEGQLGLRRFARVSLPGASPPTLVARVDAPEDPAGRPAGTAPEPPLEPIRGCLERAGLPVPARLGGDPDRGVELLEDVGDRSLRDAAAAADAAMRRALYAEACALVPRIQRVAPEPGVAAFGRRLDRETLAYKAELFAAHGLALRGAPARPAEREAVRTAFARIADAVDGAPVRLSHRDFQSANLHVVPPRPDGSRLVMLDLQGAWLAPPEYDLVCLLRDSYVELGADERGEQLRRVHPELPDAPAAEVFERRFDLLTLSRKGKDLGRFAQAARERGDRRFLRFVPATVRALQAAAAAAAARDPALAELAALVAGLPETPTDPPPEPPCGP